MRVCVIGTGYVGLVVGTCLSDLGFRVTCVDKVADKIAMLQQGEVPIYEPGLDAIIRRNTREGRLDFSTDTSGVISQSSVVYIAVGTPPRDDGSADVGGVLTVARIIGEAMARPCTIVIKSTVPVGTADKVRDIIGGCTEHAFDVVSNPEFLKEGTAIDDWVRPDRIVVGCRTQHAREVMERLYSGLVRKGRPILFMDNRSAELTKYAANSLLATKISFMNELSILCERVGADIEDVRRGTGSDSRIGPKFLFAGAGYGGSCFPKDVKALIHMGEENDLQLRIAGAVETVNARQKHVIADKIYRHFGGDVAGKHIAVWGLAFKPGTDDVREAPALVIIERLLEGGATVAAFDPEATATTRVEIGDVITYCDSPMSAVEGADALVVMTEWPEFKNPDFERLATMLAGRVLFDGRNIYEPGQVREAGLSYYGIGRS